MPASSVGRPVQNLGHVPGSFVPGSQVLRAGTRTRKATAGGRHGYTAESPPIDDEPTGTEFADLSAVVTSPPAPAAAISAPEVTKKPRRLRIPPDNNAAGPPPSSACGSRRSR